MSGVSRNHGELESNLMTFLTTALRARGCRVYPANIRVQVPAAPPYRYPDLSIVCEEPGFETIGGVDVLTNPVVLVEVLSPSTEAYDRGDKFNLYKSIPTLQHYILISQTEILVDHFERSPPDEWRFYSFRDLNDVIQISDPRLTLRLSEIFRRAF